MSGWVSVVVLCCYVMLCYITMVWSSLGEKQEEGEGERKSSCLSVSLSVCQPVCLSVCSSSRTRH